MIKLKIISLLLTMALVPFASSAQEYWENADVERGMQQFERCMACHTTTKDGRHKVGPNLYGIWGKQAGSEVTFGNYSDAMRRSNVVWDYYTLDAYLGNSKMFVPENRMAHGAVNDPQERADIILYLYSLSAPEE